VSSTKKISFKAKLNSKDLRKFFEEEEDELEDD